MAQFIKIGQRFINMDRVEYVVPRENGELRVGLSEGGIHLSPVEAEEMMYWLTHNAQDIAACMASDAAEIDEVFDTHDDPDACMEHYYTEATAAELKAPVWHPA